MDGKVIRHFVLSAGVLVTLAACSPRGETTTREAQAPAPPTTTASVSQPWAHEAADFFEALGTYFPDDIEAFYAPSAFIEGASVTPDLHSLEAIREYRETTYLWGESVQQVFLARDRAIVDLPVDDWPYDEFRVFEMLDDRIVHETRGDRIQHWRELEATAESADRLQMLYTDYLAAWDSGDRVRIADLYLPGAVATDGLFGGPVRLGSPGGGLGPRPETLLGTGTRYQPVRASAIGDAAVYSPGPRAIFASLETSDPTADLPVAYAVFDVVAGGGCELRLVAEWELHGGLIAAEEIFYEAGSLRHCIDVLDLDPPEGWWTDLEPPDPLAETVTDRVATWDGTVIEIVNGSPAQHRLVRWAVNRFKVADLVSPRVATVAFPPTRLCSGSGDGAFALVHPTAARVDICLGERQICSDSICNAISIYAQRTLLHELGHIWEHQHVDEETRETFLDQQGLSAWTDSRAKWHERGSERAAEAIAWGLMEYPITTMIPYATADELAASFRLFTGIDPLHLQ